MSNVVNAENAFGENAQQAVQPELKRVVVYEAEVIQEVLDILNKRTPVVGIDAMRQVVNVFDTLNTKGSLQEAGYASDGGYVDPSFVQDYSEAPAEAPQFVGETGVAYDAEDEIPVVEATEKENEWEHVPANDEVETEDDGN